MYCVGTGSVSTSCEGLLLSSPFPFELNAAIDAPISPVVADKEAFLTGERAGDAVDACSVLANTFGLDACCSKLPVRALLGPEVSFGAGVWSEGGCRALGEALLSCAAFGDLPDVSGCFGAVASHPAPSSDASEGSGCSLGKGSLAGDTVVRFLGGNRLGGLFAATGGEEARSDAAAGAGSDLSMAGDGEGRGRVRGTELSCFCVAEVVAGFEAVSSELAGVSLPPDADPAAGTLSDVVAGLVRGGSLRGSFSVPLRVGAGDL